MKFFQLFPLVVPYRSVLAASLSYTPATVTAETYIPLIVISITLFLLLVFLAVKLVYMKHRRTWTLHGPPAPVHSKPTCSHLSATSRVGFRDKQANRHRGLLIGCLGSPTWETGLTSKLGGATWRRDQGRRSSFAYQMHTRSARSASARSKKTSSSGSRLSKSTGCTSYASDADQLVLPLFRPSRFPPSHGGKALCSLQRDTSTGCHPRYGDFGEFHGVRSLGGGVPNITRRASPCSIRLVDGPNHSSQVDYSFLSALPPDAVAVSPLMGIRDSFQLSRCSLKCDRKPVPPLPSMPLFLPFYLPNVPEALESSCPLKTLEYLPPLRFSPLTSAAKVFYSQHEKRVPSNRVPDTDESSSRVPCFESASWSKMHHASNAGSTSPLVAQQVPTHHPVRKTNTKPSHKRSQSCTGLAIGGSSPRTALEVAALSLEDGKCSEIASMQTGILRTPSDSSRDGSVVPTKPLKSCLRQNTAVPMPLVRSPDSTPSVSETSTRTFGTGWSAGDQASLLTPISDVDIGILGLDRYRWNDEIKELKVQSSHMKKDSIALVPV